VRKYKLLHLLVPIVLLIVGTGLARAEDDLVFGPRTYERTTGSVDTYVGRFEAPTAGPFVLIVRNGDPGGSRIDAATVEINGTVVAGPADFNQQVPALHRQVEVLAGANEIRVELTGDPGSFVTLAIGRHGRAPIFVQGRLVLPWGRNDASQALGLALKNGSSRHPRVFRVVFFGPNGEVAGASERIVLPPRGSLVLGADELLDRGDWTAGSVEIYYAGPGVARVFGSARHLNLPLGDFAIEALDQAGLFVQHARPTQTEPSEARTIRR
jgi:hypothetical protein